MPMIGPHQYEDPATRLVYRTGLVLPKPGRPKVRAAAEVMPILERADVVQRLQAVGGTISLADTGLPVTNQGNHPLCWDWSMGQMAEYALFGETRKAVRLDVSIAPCEDGCLNDGNDIHAAWVDGIEPYGICPAAWMGTDPTATSNLPDMLTSTSRFPSRRAPRRSANARRTLASRSSRLSNVWVRVGTTRRTRRVLSGRPVAALSRVASRSAWLNSRSRSLAGCSGTGTIQSHCPRPSSGAARLMSSSARNGSNQSARLYL